ncbi:nuclear pore complex protein Nup188 isoform X4 [Tachypleus tridentatus]|uniref:nuclear pore complex protein Nup188 isoform X4 n=1 Tax=Tachypleus tridentatus TaxID=6853 RepID=UPI003FD34082
MPNLSAKDLWVLISGSSMLKSKELVGTQLENNASKIQNGVNYFKEPSKTLVEGLKKDSVEEPLLQFIKKLSQLLNVDEEQCYQLFCSYLLYEYKGTQGTLKSLLGNERHIQPMLHEIWNFYYSERFYIILCMKHILGHWQDSSHPYQELYEGFLETINKEGGLVHKLINQLETLTTLEGPNRDTHGQYMTENLTYSWMTFNLKEQCELLQLLLLYYREMEPAVEEVQQLLIIFQKHSFGLKQPYRQLVHETSQYLIDLIGYLEALLAVEVLELEWLFKSQEQEIGTDHYLLRKKQGLEKLDNVIGTLGNHPQHSPLLLAWMLVRFWIKDASLTNSSTFRHLGNTALQLDVFEYLCRALQTPTLSGNGKVAVLAHGVVYSLLSVLLSVFHVDTLGKMESIHKLAECLLKYQNVAEEFWEKVIATLKNFPVFTEYLENVDIRDKMITEEGGVWQLVQNRFPYDTDSLVLPRGTRGMILSQMDTKGFQLIQWHKVVNGWQVCLCELNIKLKQLAHGAGYMTQESIEKITDIGILTWSVLKSDISTYRQLTDIISELFTAFQRFSPLSVPPIKLLAVCLDIIGLLVTHKPQRIWNQLIQLSFLPFLTGTATTFSSLAGGACVNVGILGKQVAAQECVSGQYPLCIAFLNLVTSAIEVIGEDDDSTLLACLVYIVTEIFPAFYKWRYTQFGDREIIGQKCLNIFHKLLMISVDGDTFKPKSKLQVLCAFSLLNLESGQTLMKLATAGEAVVRQSLELQNTKYGQELIDTVRFSLSVLNRLLLLRNSVTEIVITSDEMQTAECPLVRAMFAQPTQRNKPHTILSIAYYVFQRQDPRLATLSVQLLKRIAKVTKAKFEEKKRSFPFTLGIGNWEITFSAQEQEKEFPMSVLACLRTESEAVKDHLLLLLQSLTVDIRLKVAILEFLTTCVAYQPGLIEMFVNLPLEKKKKEMKEDEETGSCLPKVLEILKEKKEGIYFCPPELHSAAVEFIHALWAGQQILAVDELKKDSTFWKLLCDPFLNDELVEVNDRVMAYILRTMALEVFHCNVYGSGKFDSALQDIFKMFSETSLLSKLSKHVLFTLPPSGEYDMTHRILDNSMLTDRARDSFALLTAWRDFLLVLAKMQPLKIESSEKISIMEDILTGLQSQIEMPTNSRVMILLGELYLMVLLKWDSQCYDSVAEWTSSIGALLHSLRSNADSVHPRLQVIVVSIATAALRVLARNKKNEESTVGEWFDPVCDLVRYTSLIAQKYLKQAKDASSNQLPILTICLLKELIHQSGSPKQWLSVLLQTTTIPTLLGLLIWCLQLHKGIGIAHNILTLFLALSPVPKVAEAMCSASLMDQITLLIASCYTSCEDPTITLQCSGKFPVKWLDIYQLTQQLVASLLQTLKHFFLKDALNFVGAHLERMHKSFQQVMEKPHRADIQETLGTCSLVHQLSYHQHAWRLEHMASMNLLLGDTCDVCYAATAYLIRPSLLQHFIEHSKADLDETKLISVTTQADPDSHFMKRLLSTEETDRLSPQLVQAQNRLLELLAVGLSTLQLFSPHLYEVLSDQGVDVGQWQIMLDISFSTPGVEHSGPLSFGTILSCINMCVRALTKNERVSSPAKLSHLEGPLPTERLRLQYVLETSLTLLLSQALLCLLHPALKPREKQLLRRELGAELNSVLLTMNRYLRKGAPLSPASSSSGLVSPSGHSRAVTPVSDRLFLRMITHLVKKIFNVNSSQQALTDSSCPDTVFQL